MVAEVQLDGAPDGEEPLGGDAHDDEGLAAQQHRPQRVPEVGEHPDVHLVAQVQVEVEAGHDEAGDEDEVDEGEGEDALVEVGAHAGPEEHHGRGKVAQDPQDPHAGDAHLAGKSLSCSTGFDKITFLV